jgi:hypothetical protein
MFKGWVLGKLGTGYWALGIELLRVAGEMVKFVRPALVSTCLTCTDLFTLVVEKVSRSSRKINKFEKVSGPRIRQ